MKKKILLTLSIFLFSFSFSHAEIQISEIMYNPEGSDTNREWVEIYNNGSSVDISSWYFHENDTYHGLYPDGFTNLASGQRALIVKDLATAQSELGSNLNYIKSSFSLNNTGENLIMADPDKNHIDNYSYSADDGGNGDGKSLQLVGSSWTSGNPTPGAANSSSGGSSSSNSSGNSSSDSSSDDGEVTIHIDPYYSPKLEISEVIVAQSDFDIIAEVNYVKNSKNTRQIDGYYFINFGDGNIFESNERVDSTYRYRNPGNYIIVFEYHSSKFAFEQGEEPDALIKKTVSVISHDLKILRVNAFEGVVIENNTGSTVDLSSWKILWGGEEYSFPHRSYLAAGETTSIQFATLGFTPKPNYEEIVQLVSDVYKPVSYFPKAPKKSTKSTTGKSSPTTKTSGGIDPKSLPNAELDFFGSTDSYLDQYLYENPNKLRVDFGEGEENPRTPKKENNGMVYALGSLVLMLGAARFSKHKNNTDSKKEPEDLGTIEVIE